MLPFLFLLLALVALDGGRPIFSHERIGKDGRVFRCYKIRTMFMDAEARLIEILKSDPQAAAQWAEDQKLKSDPRITRLGHILRKTSLDELPQIWNVIRGDMSLVGPRPIVFDELRRYGPEAETYKTVRPGITGLWQVCGRNQISYAERVTLDSRYARRLSFLGDTAILVRTLPAVLRSTGR